jgi:hypothetical protein
VLTFALSWPLGSPAGLTLTLASHGLQSILTPRVALLLLGLQCPFMSSEVHTLLPLLIQASPLVSSSNVVMGQSYSTVLVFFSQHFLTLEHVLLSPSPALCAHC